MDQRVTELPTPAAGTERSPARQDRDRQEQGRQAQDGQAHKERHPDRDDVTAGTLDLSEPALRRAIELLFFAYRDFTGDADAMLARYGFGRAHHRVIYFVGRHPGLSVSELLAILKITKQSLAPVLRQLMRDGFVVQRPDAGDRRRRRLHLTAEAEALEGALTRRQSERIAAAYAAVGAAAVDGFTGVLQAIVNEEDRHRFVAGPVHQPQAPSGEPQAPSGEPQAPSGEPPAPSGVGRAGR